MFRKVQQHVEMMVEMFKRAKFTLSVATKMRYDENFQFTENNIVSFLAELEEYICSLITYTAFKRDDINAAISAIPLERLINKDFNKKEIAVSNQYLWHFVDWTTSLFPSTRDWHRRRLVPRTRRCTACRGYWDYEWEVIVPELQTPFKGWWK